MADVTLIDYLCKLAKLSFADEQKEKIAAELSDIMTLMDSIKEVDIKAEDYPLSFPGKMDGLRPDDTRASLPVEAALQNVPDKKFHFIAVKKIME